MARRKKSKKRLIKEDPIYNSRIVSIMINRILMKGKKSLAQYLFYESMKRIKEITSTDPIETLKKAVSNTTPIVEVKSRRVGGATYQVPIEVKPERGNSLAIKFIVRSARNRPGKSMITKLSSEIIDASNNIGNSVKKKDEIHKMAESNKAFASLRF